MGKVTILIDVAALTRLGAKNGLDLVAERVRAVAIPRTPLELGDLRSSLTVVSASEEDLESAVTSVSPYAARQHEDLTLRHKHGGPKYLESAALDTAVDEVGKLMVEAARKALR